MIDAGFVPSFKHVRLFVDKEAIARWGTKNIEHFVSLGYEFTGLFDEFTVSVSDLCPGSKIRVRVMCGACLQIRYIAFSQIRRFPHTLCNDCSQKHDLAGRIFDRLVVVSFDEVRNQCAHWYCRCTCGKVTSVSAESLRQGNTRSCGCLQKETAGNKRGYDHPRFKDLVGRRFRDLVVIEYLGSGKWRCQCSCGGVVTRDADHLVSGQTKNCANRKVHPPVYKNPPKPRKKRKYVTGPRATSEYVQWRTTVFERDRFQCQILDCSRKDIEVHHLNDFAGYPELRQDVNNAITLCCHHHRQKNGISYHTVCGQKSTSEQFVHWLTVTNLCLRRTINSLPPSSNSHQVSVVA
jgi:5-methylcytosine-specific restriction endonuclease McrA